MNKFLQSVLFFTFSSLPFFLTYILRKKFDVSLKSKNEDNFYHQMIFIDSKNFGCKQHLIDKKECGENCSFTYQKTLQNFLSSAKVSICLCAYMLTLKHLNYELIQAHKRGINVRVITDQVMLQVKPVRDNFEKLKENGICYKVQPSINGMMHHKFCLIDKEEEELAKMFFGSLNLTSQGLVSNFDVVILTNNLNIIQRYSEEFEELWSSFKE
ncbi:mitochondrial cardiolipin hydrolase [Leptinotarsa decemlineata]|uniref:mitochondrial cardiolipin hydrolase n=1 Tax=Leptinotarsa decemlineata TaxID=7539 RepID=UPI003D309A0C